VTGGVDTHLDLNVAAALDPVGGLLEVAEFPATSGGHRRLLGWLAGFGPVARVGVEGTGSYGAGLARYLRAAGVEVVEVDRPNRQARRRVGKSDPVDAIEAARAALSGRVLIRRRRWASSGARLPATWRGTPGMPVWVSDGLVSSC
jgi:transposase